jgi:hypothetical protein
MLALRQKPPVLTPPKGTSESRAVVGDRLSEFAVQMTDASEQQGGARPPDSRRGHDPPWVVAKLGWRYHHIGVPTEIERRGEKYLARFKMYVSGFDSSPFGIEWMRFEPDCPLPELIKTVPHIAFEVDDLDAALQGHEILYAPTSPSEGVRSAMIIHNGAPVELITFRRGSAGHEA